MTKNELVAELASTMRTTKVQVKAFLEALSDTVAHSLNEEGHCILPGIVKMTVVKTAARAEREGRNPFTDEPMRIPAKPEGKRLRARFSGSLKTAVCQGSTAK